MSRSSLSVLSVALLVVAVGLLIAALTYDGNAMWIGLGSAAVALVAVFVSASGRRLR
ncbi:hypothetical protein [Nocardioides sp. cx-173]|uniref:hypothetical protein n=1 Tax=Nocardioides sp. cx-173 TaxID=2898796 RepID=UPI001E2E3050|nr:hypothetical protein [Nocardioides sp. cx-173]MCD4527308.1 hypothetical protein [Nocardioides sp. cx-173]UGB43607.1 hypothetical protein LQ940_08790 [Nocardioides sp. cx-173]